MTSMLDLSKCYLLTEMKLKRKDNATGQLVNLDNGEVVAPIQMIGGTFIKNLKLSINGREVFDTNGK